MSHHLKISTTDESVYLYLLYMYLSISLPQRPVSSNITQPVINITHSEYYYPQVRVKTQVRVILPTCETYVRSSPLESILLFPNKLENEKKS